MFPSIYTEKKNIFELRRFFNIFFPLSLTRINTFRPDAHWKERVVHAVVAASDERAEKIRFQSSLCI